MGRPQGASSLSAALSGPKGTVDASLGHKDSLVQPSRFYAMASGLQDGPYALQIGTARGAARSSGPGRGRAVDVHLQVN